MSQNDDDPGSWSHGLTDREIRFVQEYLVDLSARKAAIRSKIATNPKAASEAASRIRRKQSVAHAISKLLAERSGATQSRLIEELAKLALCDVTDYAKVVNGRLVVTDTADLTPDQRAAIVGIKETINEKGHSTIEYKFDRIAAIDRLARAVGLFKQHVEVSGPNGGPIQIEDSVAELEAMIETIARRKAAALPVVAELQPPPLRISAPQIRQPAPIIDAE